MYQCMIDIMKNIHAISVNVKSQRVFCVLCGRQIVQASNWQCIIKIVSKVTSTRLIKAIPVKLILHVSKSSPILTVYMVTFVLLHPCDSNSCKLTVLVKTVNLRDCCVKTQIWLYNRLIWTMIWRHEKSILPGLSLLTGSMSHMRQI